MKDFKLVKEKTKELNVLYVEDDEQVCESTATLLDNFFLTLDIEYDGQAGLDTYLSYKKEYGVYYDLVITDINMPRLDGIEMSLEILKHNPEQSIIVVTAMNEIEMLYAVLDCGVSGFLTKPINNAKLKNVLYKVGSALSNKKLLESHIDMIEDLNIRLESQNRELREKNEDLDKSSRMLDTMVLKEQLQAPQVQEKNTQHFEEQINDLINDDLHELKEIHIEIDLVVIDILAKKKLISLDVLEDLTGKFTKYATILSYYTFFDELGSAMKVFASTIETHPNPSSEENAQNALMLLESFVYVLGKWQTDILDKNFSNINALDASMISDMKTIVNMWTRKEDANSEEEWDNIFDF